MAIPGRLDAEIVPGPIPAQVERVIDGDTLAVRALIWPDQHVQIKVRLARINAPEVFKPHCPSEKNVAVQATDLVRNRVGKVVLLRAVHLGKYAGRVVARVETETGEDLSQLLLNAGLAVLQGSPSPWCSINTPPYRAFSHRHLPSEIRGFCAGFVRRF